MNLRTYMMMSAIAKNPLLEGMVAYWKLDGNSNDELGNHNGTATNITYSVAHGKIGQGGDFNTSKIVISSSPEFSFSNAFSISFWMNSSDSSGDYKCFISRPYSPVNGEFGWAVNTGSAGNKMEVNLRGVSPASFEINASVYDGKWHHVVLTFGDNQVSFYIDNVLTDQTSTSGSLSGSNSNVCIGAFHGNYFPEYSYNGKLDEIGVWNRTLTASEVAKLFNAGVGKQFPFNSSSPNSLQNSLIAGWNFDGNANDVLGVNHGTATNVVFNPSSGIVNMAAFFNGTNSSRVAVQSFPEFQFNGGNFSLSMWLRRSMISNNEEFFFAQCGASGSNTSISIILSIEPGNIINGTVCSGTSSGAARSVTAINNQAWNHVVFQRDGDSLKLYINSVLEDSVPYNSDINVVSETIGIGSAGDYVIKNFKGSMDCVYAYNRTLSTNEINYLFNSGNGRQYPF